MKLQLHWQILIAIALAIFIGAFFNEDSKLIGISILGVSEFIGQMFLNALKMVVVPLVLSSIICGVSNLNVGSDIGRLGGKTLGFYMMSSLLAILVGLVLVNMTQPGITGPDEPPLLEVTENSETAEHLKKVEGRDTSDIFAVFLRMLPPNIVKAAADGQMLGLIVFGMLFGFFMLKIEQRRRETMVTFWQAVFDTMMHITMFIMKFSPIGVFGLVLTTMLKTGFESFGPVLLFFVTVFLALATHMFVTMPILLKTLAKVNPIRHYRAMAPAMLTAFSTASSSGTLPITMECVEKNANVSNRTTSFVLPLGATINMDGTALYECVAAMFIAQAFGLELTFATQFTIVLVALLTSIGVAGIPSASLVAITVILAAIGLPLEGIGLLMITDRILDMMRTAVNVFSDSCCAVVIAASEGEKDLLPG